MNLLAFLWDAVRVLHALSTEGKWTHLPRPWLLSGGSNIAAFSGARLSMLASYTQQNR